MSSRITKGKGLFGSVQTSGALSVGGTFGVTGAAVFGSTVGMGAITPTSITMGKTISGITRGTVPIDPAQLTTQAKGTTFAVIAGASATDLYFFEPPAALEAGLYYGGYVPAAGSVGVILTAGTATINGGSLDWPYTRIACA